MTTQQLKNIMNPIGTIIAYSVNSAPEGYLKCEGQAVSRTEYGALFNIIGTTYGAGDGSTTFNVPDLRGEFLRGTGQNGHANQGWGANVGTHQDATTIPWINLGPNKTSPDINIAFDLGDLDNNGYYWPKNKDSGITLKGKNRRTNINIDSISDSGLNYSSYTTRPTNTSVLYCIKY